MMKVLPDEQESQCLGEQRQKIEQKKNKKNWEDFGLRCPVIQEKFQHNFASTIS